MELTVDGVFIPNDTVMGESGARVHVITGPNVSGKSCYMKQARAPVASIYCLCQCTKFSELYEVCRCYFVH